MENVPETASQQISRLIQDRSEKKPVEMLPAPRPQNDERRKRMEELWELCTPQWMASKKLQLAEAYERRTPSLIDWLQMEVIKRDALIQELEDSIASLKREVDEEREGRKRKNYAYDCAFRELQTLKNEAKP